METSRADTTKIQLAQGYLGALLIIFIRTTMLLITDTHQYTEIPLVKGLIYCFVANLTVFSLLSLPRLVRLEKIYPFKRLTFKKGLEYFLTGLFYTVIFYAVCNHYTTLYVAYLIPGISSKDLAIMDHMRMPLNVLVVFCGILSLWLIKKIMRVVYRMVPQKWEYYEFAGDIATTAFGTIILFNIVEVEYLNQGAYNYLTELTVFAAQYCYFYFFGIMTVIFILDIFATLFGNFRYKVSRNRLTLKRNEQQKKLCNKRGIEITCCKKGNALLVTVLFEGKSHEVEFQFPNCENKEQDPVQRFSLGSRDFTIRSWEVTNLVNRTCEYVFHVESRLVDEYFSA